jgi:ABC-type branched-subunit amino acid transport system substrate-binding protein
MLSALTALRKSLRIFTPSRRFLVAGIGALALSACVPTGGPRVAGPEVATDGPVPVALLVPGGSGQASDDILARSLENAARLAMADLSGVQIDLRVYNTAGQPGQAQDAAMQAVADGAVVILGPVFAQEANAAGVAVASQGVSVLSFSNNPDIAGRNVFVLGPTFDNSARRLASYAVRTGRSNVMIIHERNTAGELGKTAIERGVRAAGGKVVAVGGYEFSQSGVVAAVPPIAASAKANGANAVFLTADTAGALPLLSQLLSENGLPSSVAQYIGLTRWDIPPATLSLPGVQGGWFALPDPGLYAQFQSRYQAAYGEAPHPIAGLAYDGIAAIGALARRGGRLDAGALTQGSGFVGVNGIFRLRPDGTNERGLAIAQIRNSQVVVIDPAPRSFSGAGF